MLWAVDVAALSCAIFAVVPANAGTHNPREKFGEDSSFGTVTFVDR
jgi:hypothetical protein